VVFSNLYKDEIMQIIDLEMRNVIKRLHERNITIHLDPAAKEFLFAKGYDEQYGARPIRRAIEQFIEDAMSESILRDEIPEHSNVSISVTNDALDFSIEPIEKKCPTETETPEPDADQQQVEQTTE
jgi:ATP-dependent Clp protease ATP-binding subunit ClpC